MVYIDSMCGRLNIIDSPEVRALCAILGIKLYPNTRLNLAPGAIGQFVLQRDGDRQLVEGMWSMRIEPKPSGQGYRPIPGVSTFNARYDKLTASKLWHPRYLSKRCIVPATGFHEWRDKDKQPFQLQHPDRALALGGLYEFWRFGDELVPTFTIITGPPAASTEHIHKKSLPLLLEPGDFDAWLDPEFKHVDEFQDLFRPRLRHPLLATPIDSTLKLNPVGEPELIPADV